MAKSKKLEKLKSKAAKSAIIINQHSAFILLSSAVRYALGRRTSAVEDVCDQVYAIASKLTPMQRAILIRDITECKDYGAECDEKDWFSLLKWLKSQPYPTEFIQ